MDPRISIVTLGVQDMERARAFYQKMGFAPSSASNESVTFFHSAGTVLGLYGREALAEDAQVDPGVAADFSGVALAHNCRKESDVDLVLQQAEAAGATILKPAQKVFWGGYSGYFADPDGHLWEIAHNPFFEFDDQDQLILPDGSDEP